MLSLPGGLVPGPGHFTSVSISPWVAPLRHHITQQTHAQLLETPDKRIIFRNAHPQAVLKLLPLIAFLLPLITNFALPLLSVL